MEKVIVLGLGYIGLPTAAMLARNGSEVVGVDINHDIITTLINGHIHIKEEGLLDLVQSVLKQGRLRVSDQIEHADVFIIAVPTPIMPDKSADMRAVVSATKSIIPFLRKNNLVILESTSPPGTTINLVQPILDTSGLQAGKDYLLSYSPERVLPGRIIKELEQNSRVIGGIDKESAQAAKRIYQTFVTGEIILTNTTTAEMIKLMENTYRDINIAIANEFARLADKMGINVWEAIEIANRHPRVNILNPGPGVGGHCISVDPWFLVEAAPQQAALTRTAREVNDSQPAFVIDLIKRTVGDLKGKRITLLGLAYKPNVDDLRESPAIDIARLLSAEGVRVTAYEPFNTKAKFEVFETVGSLEIAVKDAHAIVLAVKHDMFCQLLPKELTKITPARILIDTVNAWHSENWRAFNFNISTLGDAGT